MNWTDFSVPEALQAEGALHLGSWTLNVYATAANYLETLGLLVRQGIAQQAVVADPDVKLYLVGAPRDSDYFPITPAPEPLANARWQQIAPHAHMLYTSWFRLVVDRACEPHRIIWYIREPQYSARAFRDHLFEILSKLLFFYDRFYVHAAAVQFHDNVNLFVAQGGQGKTTVSVTLANAGATILSEDHVVIHRDDTGSYRVSGCQNTMRVTTKTETLLAFGPPVPAVDGIGGPKKEFPVANYFRAAPFRDFSFQRIFFNQLGSQYKLARLSRQSAQLQCMFMTRSFFRPDDQDDLARYLDFWDGVVRDRECYALELSPDLTTLRQLVAFLRGEHN